MKEIIVGEAIRKKLLGLTAVAPVPPGFNRDAFAKSVIALMRAAGDRNDANCWTHAALACEALRRLGVQAEVRAGYAAWRVDGACGHAVVTHHPGGQVLETGANLLLYHAWVSVGREIADFSTWTLPIKAEKADAMDGQITPVTWTPEYLWVPEKTALHYHRVRDGWQAGLYCYERVEAIERFLAADAPGIDEAGVQTILTCYRLALNGESVRVIGPNNGFTSGQ